MPRSYQATPGRSATSPTAQLDEARIGRTWWSESMTLSDRDTDGRGVRPDPLSGVSWCWRRPPWWSFRRPLKVD